MLPDLVENGCFDECACAQNEYRNRYKRAWRFHVVSVVCMTHTTTLDVVVMVQSHFPVRIVHVCNYVSNHLYFRVKLTPPGVILR